MVEGELSALSLPGDLVLIAQGWCGAVAAALLLKLPIRCLYLDPSVLPFYGSLLSDTSVDVCDISSVAGAVFSPSSTLVINGSVDFFMRLNKFHVLQDVRRVMWIANMPQVHRSRTDISRSLGAARKACLQHGLKAVYFKHRDYGGATTAQHVIGFSSDFRLAPGSFQHPPNVQRALQHFWKPAAKLDHPIRLDRELLVAARRFTTSL